MLPLNSIALRFSIFTIIMLGTSSKGYCGKDQINQINLNKLNNLCPPFNPLAGEQKQINNINQILTDIDRQHTKPYPLKIKKNNTYEYQYLYEALNRNQSEEVMEIGADLTPTLVGQNAYHVGFGAPATKRELSHIAPDHFIDGSAVEVIPKSLAGHKFRTIFAAGIALSTDIYKNERDKNEDIEKFLNVIHDKLKPDGEFYLLELGARTEEESEKYVEIGNKMGFHVKKILVNHYPGYKGATRALVFTLGSNHSQ